MKRDELANRVYDLVCGNINTADFPIPESYVVRDEFAPGSDCAEAYDKALAAYSRLCARLGVEDLNDKDVEVIINSFMSISRWVGIKMFNYGQAFANTKKP